MSISNKATLIKYDLSKQWTKSNNHKYLLNTPVVQLLVFKTMGPIKGVGQSSECHNIQKYYSNSLCFRSIVYSPLRKCQNGAEPYY